MKTTIAALSLALLAVQSHAVTIDGTVCRMNRTLDRMIVLSDSGARVRISVGRSVMVRYAAHPYDREDLRPGDRVRIDADRRPGGLIARQFDVTMRVDDALIDSIFRSHRTVTGRFAVREGKTDFFSLHLPHQRYIRVDAKVAYGPDGHVRVANLRSGDLLEVRGTWASKDLLQASTISVMTDREPSFCTSQARRNEETTAETAAREADEQRFLDKSEE